MSRICVYLEPELLDRLATEAVAQGVSLSSYARSKLAPPVQTTTGRFGVKITGGHSKIEMIKGVRSVTGWGLLEAKEFVERPTEERILDGYVERAWSYETGYTVQKTFENLTQSEALHLIQLLAKDKIEACLLTL